MLWLALLLWLSGSRIAMAYYAVRIGKVPGIYRSWDECQNQVKGHPGAVFKKFSTSIDAGVFMQSSSSSSSSSFSSSSFSCSSALAAAAPPADVAARASKPPAVGDLGKPCKCGQPSICVKSASEKNPGRLFWACNTATRCSGFLRWADGSGESSPRGSGSNVHHGVVPELRIYTDGACKGNNFVHSKVCPAGFGVAVYVHASGASMCELFGPVELDAQSPFFLGAEVGSNNTAELTALGESLYWIRDVGTTAAFPGPVRVLYDSEYAFKSISGEYDGKKNRALIERIRVLYAECRRARPGSLLQFEHVKGHSGDAGNDRADEIAGLGATGLRCVSGRFGQTSVAVGSKRPREEEEQQKKKQPMTKTAQCECDRNHFCEECM